MICLATNAGNISPSVIQCLTEMAVCTGHKIRKRGGLGNLFIEHCDSIYRYTK